MVNVSNKNTRKKCEICPGGSYSEKFMGGTISQRGGYSPEENYLEVTVRGVVVFGGIIRG